MDHVKTCRHDQGYPGSAPEICSDCEAERERAASGPGSRHLSFSATAAYPSLRCIRCNQQAFILHHAQAPEPTLLECSCCGDVINLGMLHYIYPDGVHPDALAGRGDECNRCCEIVNRILGSASLDGLGRDKEARLITTAIRSGK